MVCIAFLSSNIVFSEVRDHGFHTSPKPSKFKNTKGLFFQHCRYQEGLWEGWFLLPSEPVLPGM